MKRISLFVLCLLSSVAISASDIKVSMPDGWIKVENSVLEHHYLKSGASFMIKEETVLNGKSLNEAVDAAKQNLGHYFKDFELLTEEKITVDNKDGQSITFDYSAKAGAVAISMTMQTVYVMVKGKCQTLSFAALETEFSNLAPEIKLIIKNIKFRIE